LTGERERADPLGGRCEGSPERLSRSDQGRIWILIAQAAKGPTDERTWYRVIYLTRIGNDLYVLHAFEKNSRKTDRRDLEIAKSRLRLVLAELRISKEQDDGQDN
jgi:hypothetical protein